MNFGNESVSCLTVSRVQASRAVNHLINAGFAFNEISVLLPCGPGFASKAQPQAVPFSETCLTTPDWEVGGAMGWLTDIGAFVLPGVGRFVIAGPLSLAIGGPTAAINSVEIQNALKKLGLPSLEAQLCEERVQRGETFISLRTNGPGATEAATRIFRTVGAELVPSAPPETNLAPAGLFAGLVMATAAVG